MRLQAKLLQNVFVNYNNSMCASVWAWKSVYTIYGITCSTLYIYIKYTVHYKYIQYIKNTYICILDNDYSLNNLVIWPMLMKYIASSHMLADENVRYCTELSQKEWWTTHYKNVYWYMWEQTVFSLQYLLFKSLLRGLTFLSPGV